MLLRESEISDLEVSVIVLVNQEQILWLNGELESSNHDGRSNGHVQPLRGESKAFVSILEMNILI